MSALNDHGIAKSRLIAWYERVLGDDESKVLQIDRDTRGVTSASLREARTNLETERFIVAFCGQMNAGKSTLLNALLFGDSILPMAATTMTAKITILEGRHADRVAGTLFTPEQFDQVVRAANADPVAGKELSAAREAARATGLRESELLRSPPRTEERTALKDLREFVAVPDKGGVFTPYVQSVTLHSDIEWLQQVTIADTPGTSDPNPERDRLTKEWINVADAVIYVTYAGQAGLDAADVEFVDTYLRHIDGRRRMIAVNKCDIQDDAAAVWSHVHRLSRSDDLRMQELFGDDKSIVLVSGLAGLIARMLEEGRPISPDWGEDRDFLEDNGWLDGQRHGVDELRARVEERIIATKGNNVISSHRRRLDAVFERAERAVQEDVASLVFKLEAVAATHEQRAQETQRIQQAIEGVHDLVMTVRKRVTKVTHRAVKEADDELRFLAKRMATQAVDELKKVKNLGNLPSQASWVVQRVFKHKGSGLGDALNGLFEAAEQELNRAESELSEQLLGNGLGERKLGRHILPLSAVSLVRTIEAQVKQMIDRDQFAKVVSQSTNFFQAFFNTPGGREDAIEALVSELEPVIFDAVDALTSRAAADVNQAVQEAVATMQSSINGILDRRRETLQRLAAEELDANNAHEQLMAEISVFQDTLRRIGTMRIEFNAELDG